MKPREKFVSCGPESLSDQELLAILIGSGTAGLSAHQIAAGLLDYTSGSLARIAAMSPGELCSVKGIGQATPSRSEPVSKSPAAPPGKRTKPP